jgi:transcriptional regulator with XRE-family HTH domain
LRQLRLRKKIALVDLGRHAGLSASMLSQLENGKLVPTLPTLACIAMVFDVGLDHFFGNRRGEKMFALIRAAERMRFPDRPDAPTPAYRAELPRREQREVQEHLHDGAEFIFVLKGTLGIRFEGEEHRLKEGDSLYFDSSARAPWW